MNTFEPKYAKFFYEDLDTPCTWEQMTKQQLAEFCDLAAGTYFTYKAACDRDFANFNAIVSNQNEQIAKLQKGRMVRNWLLFLSVCFTLFVMLYDAGVLF